MQLRIPYCFAKKSKLPMRPLTQGEIALATSIFGELIDYKQVKIINYPYIPWQAADIFIAPNGFIFVGDRHYKDDFSQYGQRYEQIFIHEMTHVMQYQHGIQVLLKGAWLQSLYYLSFKKYNPYVYQWDKHKSFWQYNIEQQGRIAEHIYLGILPNIIRHRQKKP